MSSASDAPQVVSEVAVPARPGTDLAADRAADVAVDHVVLIRRAARQMRERTTAAAGLVLPRAVVEELTCWMDDVAIDEAEYYHANPDVTGEPHPGDAAYGAVLIAAAWELAHEPEVSGG